MALRPYQLECLDNILEARERRVRRQLVSMAGGLGKSICFGALPQHSNNKRTLLTVHTKELVDQAANHFIKWNPGVSVGIEMADQITTDEEVVVASIQTIGRELGTRRNKFRPEDFAWVVSDECHRSLSESYRTVFDHFQLFDDTKNSPTLVGFTATPHRGDGLAMGAVYEEIVFSYSMQDGIREGWLSDVRGIRVKTTTDISNVGSVAGDFKQDELSLAVNNPRRNEAIVDTWIRECYPRRTIGFTVDIQHAKDLALCFQKRGVPAVAIWGNDPDRKTKLEQHRSGILQILLCSQLLVEGYDDPMVSCVIQAKPSRSLTFFIQSTVRGDRLDPRIDNLVKARAEGRLRPEHKVDMIVLDVCDVTTKHSLVTLPTLFGLGASVDLNGQSAMQLAKKIEEEQAKHPDIDFSKLEDLSNLRTFIEEASLFKVNFCQEVVDNSLLQWHKSAENSYRLILPGKEKMMIEGDLLGKYKVNGVVLGARVSQEGFSDLASALGFAENHLSKHGKSLLTLLRRKSKWHDAPMSDGQLKLLRKFKVPESVIKTMNKGSAAAWITRKLGDKR